MAAPPKVAAGRRTQRLRETERQPRNLVAARVRVFQDGWALGKGSIGVPLREAPLQNLESPQRNSEYWRLFRLYWRQRLQSNSQITCPSAKREAPLVGTLSAPQLLPLPTFFRHPCRNPRRFPCSVAYTEKKTTPFSSENLSTPVSNSLSYPCRTRESAVHNIEPLQYNFYWCDGEF